MDGFHPVDIDIGFLQLPQPVVDRLVFKQFYIPAVGQSGIDVSLPVKVRIVSKVSRDSHKGILHAAPRSFDQVDGIFVSRHVPVVVQNLSPDVVLVL